jgi:FAD/FMN-containing dehydrogenase
VSRCRAHLQGDGSSITVEPGLIGGEVNRILAAHKNKNKLPVQYKIGPDPSSIDSCMIGGIVNNNSSGMCCGVSQVRAWLPPRGSSRRSRALARTQWITVA